MDLHVYLDPKRVEQIQRMFADFPRTIGRIFKESINKTAGKARTDIVAAGNKLTGIRKGVIRRFTSIKRATEKKWSAVVRAYSRKIPVAYLDMDKGPVTERKIQTTAKQSVWLYYNIFRGKYGKGAIFSRKYKISRKCYDYITYKISGKKTEVPAGSFIAKMPSGHVGVFQKKSKNPHSGIREVVGPSIGQILQDNRIEVAGIQAKAMKSLQSDINARVMRYLQSKKLRGAA